MFCEQEILYVVQLGDNLNRIGQKFQVTVYDIKKANPETNLDIIRPGQQIRICPKRFSRLQVINTIRML